jgi:hypothetical protein
MELTNKRIIYDLLSTVDNFDISGEATFSVGNQFMRFNGNVRDAQGVTFGSIFYSMEDNDNVSVQFSNIKGDLVKDMVNIANAIVEELKNMK